jgi:monovalent cation/proton antiporter MnhG/PhaG subunit
VTEEVVIGVLLGAAVLLVLVSSVGVLVMRDVYQRLHYVAPIAVVAPLLVAVAVTVKEGWDENTGATWLALGFVVVTTPFLSHATVRAARIRQRGDWREPSEGGQQGRRRQRVG